MIPEDLKREKLGYARSVATQFIDDPAVLGVYLSGSLQAGLGSSASDVDLFVVGATEPAGAEARQFLSGDLHLWAEQGAYDPVANVWVAAGGVWAIANVRGGNEEGRAWHDAGRRRHEQKSFDDFIAAAEWLCRNRLTSPPNLAISGSSNGGLLVGAALTQRPELCAAAHCGAPLLDMVRYEQFGLGRLWTEEFGRAADPEEFGWLLAYSPYHRVRQGARYPAPRSPSGSCTCTDWTTTCEPRQRRTCDEPAPPPAGGRVAVVPGAVHLAQPLGLRLQPDRHAGDADPAVRSARPVHRHGHLPPLSSTGC